MLTFDGGRYSKEELKIDESAPESSGPIWIVPIMYRNYRNDFLYGLSGPIWDLILMREKIIKYLKFSRGERRSRRIWKKLIFGRRRAVFVLGKGRKSRNRFQSLISIDDCFEKKKYRCFVLLHLMFHSSSVCVFVVELKYLEDSVPKQIPKPDPGQSLARGLEEEAGGPARSIVEHQAFNHVVRGVGGEATGLVA
ncbi:hypothetical protein KFK09_005912 [Dendrobium nobile]|uniref:Uncharacterized protein n=1 Tax=Dendrobium nobile TaxID=94219 RepID=A0A8T3BX46_DENNO|nr:hypothetical protein KFK09_005912 [Dendrobium nobile]